MSLNTTPSGERVHVGIFGRRNAGKSSLINALTGQNIAIVSEIKGTTTDPVYKTMELLPLGPVMLIDTPGIDDEGALGQQRIAKAFQVLNKCHIALLVLDATQGISKEDLNLWQLITAKELPSILVINKIELLSEKEKSTLVAQISKITTHYFCVSTVKEINIHELKEAIAALKPTETKRQLVGDLLNPNDLIVLVTPIDSAAPKGRLILPQQQVLRDILDHNAMAVVVQETQLAEALKVLIKKPRLVITDSQAFAKVNKIVPQNILLTSFSILMARYKGSLYNAVKAVRTLDHIVDKDKILISEGCTHHRQCQDIGTVKLPNWIRTYTKSQPEFFYTSGTEFPTNLSSYKLIIHCGACMLNEKEVIHRNKCAIAQNVPMTNYGIAIAYMHGILQRTLAPLPQVAQLLN